jgi:hypothetical protein
MIDAIRTSELFISPPSEFKTCPNTIDHLPKDARHATGRWGKKVRGKFVNFGNVADDPQGKAV